MIKSAGETLSGSSSLDVLFPNYEKALNQTVSENDLAISGLVRWTEAYHQSGMTLRKFLAEHQEEVYGTLSDNEARIKQIISLMPELLHSFDDFSNADRSVYRKAVSAYSLYGSHSDISYGASNRVAKDAMLGALDRRVMREAGQAFSLYSAQSDIRTYASGRPARDAMLGALDRRVMREAGQAYSIFIARSGLDTYASSNITSEIKDEILKESFAGSMMAEEIEQAKQLFIKENKIPWTIDVDNPPSLGQVRELQGEIDSMTAELGSLPRRSALRKRKLRSSIESMSNYRSMLEHDLGWLNSHPYLVNNWNTVKNSIAAKYQGASSDRTHQQAYEQPWQHGEDANRMDEKSRIYDHCMARLGQMDPSLARTLGSYPKKDVLRVINTVLLAREKAQKNGKELTDRDILIRYMRRSNNVTDPHPNAVRSTQIMLTLMADEVSGKLPF